jgi:hypothetical protein
MKKTLLLLIILGAQFPVFSQYIEFGTGLTFMKMQGDMLSKINNSFYPVDPSPTYSFNVTASGNIPLKFFKDEVVAGINPNAALSLFYSSIAIDVPVFATMKFGAGSSERSGAILGGGIGVGGQFSFLSTIPNSGLNQNYTTAMVMPVLMGEASVTFQNYNMYQIRVEFTPVPVQKNKEFQGQISMLTIRLIRAFF